MKYNISDLLDQFDAQDVELTGISPLSSQQIKEITMKKVNGTYKRKSKIFRKIFIAAAIIASLAVSAFAANQTLGAGDWFRSEKNLSESQMELVNELGESFQPQTYTNQGTTIEAKAAYAEDHVLYLYLSVTTPEGTVLPDGVTYDFVDRSVATDYSDPNAFHCNHLGGNAPYKALYNFMKVIALKDDDPTDNKKDFIVELTTQTNQETNFIDGYTKFLPILGIYEQVFNVNGDEDGYRLIAPCDFRVDITLNHPMEQVSLDVDGICFGGVKTRTWTHDSKCLGACEEFLTGQTDPETGLPIHEETYEYNVTARTLTLSPLSASWRNDCECSNSNMALGLAFRIVMKDGSTVEISTVNFGQIRPDNTECAGTSIFAAPIDLDDVDYVLIGDSKVGETYKVYLPQE
ncbi:MAG: hypothetical protein ACI3W5_00040 [Faecousia sp.]